MLNKLLLVVFSTLVLSACNTINLENKYQKPENLLYQNNKLAYKTITVQRDNKLCKDDTPDSQDCPISLYINDFKAGDFYINNTAKFHLKKDKYILKVKNCLNNCSNSEVKINLKEQLKNVTYILSVDHEQKPIIIIKNI